MTLVLAIDPGNTDSAFVVIDAATCRPVRFGKEPNGQVLDLLGPHGTARLCFDVAAIEMVASYGMAVGREVFETCVWVGRFQQAMADRYDGEQIASLVYRRDVKLHHCGSTKAKDPNVIQALIDRFAPGQPNRGKGTKASPGWFHGFAADVWQAYALAVTVADWITNRAGVA